MNVSVNSLSLQSGKSRHLDLACVTIDAPVFIRLTVEKSDAAVKFVM